MTTLCFAPTDRLLVIAPHPDDEVLGAGAAILAARAAGAEVRVAFATDGEGNVWVQRLLERRLRSTAADRARFGRRRRAEAVASLAVLGVSERETEFLGLPDTGLTDAVRRGDDRVRASVRTLLDRVRPTVVIGASPADLHPDHGALGVVVRGILGTDVAGPCVLEFCVHGSAPRGTERVRFPPRSPRRLRAALARHEAPMTVHARAFHARMGRPLDLERIAPGRPPASPSAGLRVVLRDDGGRLRPRARELLLVGCTGDGPWPCFVVALGKEGAAVPVRDPLGAVRASACVRRIGGRTHVDLHPPDVGPCTWFAKAVRPGGFYDAAGWTRVDAAAPALGRRQAPAPLRVLAVIPCYQVERWCGPVVEGAAQRCDRVLTIDDGSTDGTLEVLRRCAAAAPERVGVLRFPANRGKGTVLRAAFSHALASEPFDVLVTMDGDGQHRPEDLPRLVEACATGADLAIGSREVGAHMPLRSRVGNTLTSLWLRRMFPRCPSDTQSGLRAHSRALVERVVRETHGERYETEVEILLTALAAGLRVESVPIAAIYLEGNRSSHFRPVRDGLRVYAAVARWWLRRHLSARRRVSRDPVLQAIEERAPRSFGVPKRARVHGLSRRDLESQGTP